MLARLISVIEALKLVYILSLKVKYASKIVSKGLCIINNYPALLISSVCYRFSKWVGWGYNTIASHLSLLVVQLLDGLEISSKLIRPPL